MAYHRMLVGGLDEVKRAKRWNMIGPSQKRQPFKFIRKKCNEIVLSMCTAQCGTMEAKALSFILHAAGSEHHRSSTRREFTYVVGRRVGMNDTCSISLLTSPPHPTHPMTAVASRMCGGLRATQTEVVDVDSLEENQIPLVSFQDDAILDFDDFPNVASDVIPSHELDERFAFIKEQDSNPDHVVESAIVDNDVVDLEPDPQIYQRALASSLVNSVDSGIPKLSWETGVMSAIFSTDPVVDMFPKMHQLSADSVPVPIPGNSFRPDPQQRKRVFEAAFIPGVSSRVSQRRREHGLSNSA